MAATKLQQALDQVNGRRRQRLLDLSDLVEVASQLRPGQHRFLHGGHVANAYKYPAHATGAVVWIPTGKRAAFATVKIVNASKGASGFGCSDAWDPTKIDSAAIRITPQDKRAAGATVTAATG